MIIEREYNPNLVGITHIDSGEVFSDENGDGLYLLIDSKEGLCSAFDLESNTLEDWHSEIMVIIRKAKLVLED